MRHEFGELTMLVLEGVACNFVAPIGVGLGPWAVMLVRDFAGGQASGTYLAYAIDIATGSLALAVIAPMAYDVSFSAMHVRAKFMITVARLAQRIAMLDVAERCLRDCLDLARGMAALPTPWRPTPGWSRCWLSRAAWRKRRRTSRRFATCAPYSSRAGAVSPQVRGFPCAMVPDWACECQ